MTELVRRVTFGRHKQKKKWPHFKAGDTLGVYVQVKEGVKTRVQLFKGVVIKIQGSGMGKSFTVRKMSSGVGVEKIFPFASPFIDKIDLISQGQVRRSRIFYLRKLKGRAARLTSKLVDPATRRAAEIEAKAAEAEATEVSSERSKA